MTALTEAGLNAAAVDPNEASGPGVMFFTEVTEEFLELLRHKGRALRLRRVQQVVAFAILAFAREFVEAGAAPDVGHHVPVFLQQFLCRQRFAQDAAGTQQLDPRPA